MSEYVNKLMKLNSQYDRALLEKAYKTAEELHKEQKRKSGEPYIIHPMAVGVILAELGMDDKTVAAGILHDIVEDTPYTLDQLKAEFGAEIAEMVDGVTKLTNLNYISKAESQAENTRKMFLAMCKDIRIIVIKLADRLHNLRTINYMSEAKIKEKCTESLDIYAPLAARLGMYAFKFEIEDICFRNLEPTAYAKLQEELYELQQHRSKGVDEIINDVEKVLDELNIKYTIYGRTKQSYSIFKKMRFQKKGLMEIFDLTAVRIIVDSVKDCYAVLGAVHTRYTPIPGRFKDYIAMPKPNNYQSLHTTVLTDHGFPFEIQIRTEEMHHIAEYGIAAHWKYKEGIQADDEETKLAWLRQTLEWQKETSDSQEFVETLKMDLFSNQVFVFTPAGDVMELPAGSTPLDFAFKVHTNVGIHCVGAKVNGKIVTINYVLQNGDRVEIITNNSSKGPSADWLNIAKSNSAKTKIRQFLNKQEKALQPEAKEKDKEKPKEVVKEIADIEEKPVIKAVTRHTTATQGIAVKGIDNLFVRFARCCNPVPGDAIIGYTTKGRGVSVHRADCLNMQSLPEKELGRLIDVEWTVTEDNMLFEAAMDLLCNDRKGLLSDISKVCEDMDINIASLNSRIVSDNKFIISLVLQINNTGDIQKLTNRFKQIKDVKEVYRSNQ